MVMVRYDPARLIKQICIRPGAIDQCFNLQRERLIGHSIATLDLPLGSRFIPSQSFDGNIVSDQGTGIHRLSDKVKNEARVIVIKIAIRILQAAHNFTRRNLRRLPFYLGSRQITRYLHPAVTHQPVE